MRSWKISVNLEYGNSLTRSGFVVFECICLNCVFALYSVSSVLTLEKATMKNVIRM